jgi:hypothetical protein
VQSADPDHVLVSEAVAAACAAERGLPPPAVRAIAAKGKPDGIRCARFDWRAAAFVDHGWPPPPSPMPPLSPPYSSSPAVAMSHPPPALSWVSEDDNLPSTQGSPNGAAYCAAAATSGVGVGVGVGGAESAVPYAPAGPSMGAFSLESPKQQPLSQLELPPPLEPLVRCEPAAPVAGELSTAAVSAGVKGAARWTGSTAAAGPAIPED